MSVSAENCLSHRGGTSTDSRRASSSSYWRGEVDQVLDDDPVVDREDRLSAALTTLRIRTSWPAGRQARWPG
jgi:hypothetical protein